jgi:hypothetical protein
MLRIQILGLALASALLMSVVAAGSASAATELHQWLLIHDQSGIHLLLAEPIKVHSLGLLLLEDTKATGGAVEVHCHGFDAGTVGPHGLDLTESITLELLGTKKSVSCTFDKVGNCKSGTEPTAEAVHLPWHTELLLRGGIVRDLILSDGAGAPGYAVTCTNILGGKTTDTCEEEKEKPGSTIMTNVVGSGVLAEFEGTAGSKSKCSVGGAGAGIVSGTDLTENPSSTLLLAISFGP